jgi:glycine/D-amino acid oxidase-like deaminating enzyme
MTMQPLPAPPRSLWLDSSGPYEALPSLEGDRTVDVAIIGGGFTGLTTAYELRRADPGLRVAVLEAREIGYGSSGRNGSFAMTVVGLGFGATAKLRGRTFLRRAHRYMMHAVDALDALIDAERLDCDRLRPGFLRVATTPSYVETLKRDVELMRALGFDDIHWVERDEVRARVNSPHHLGAIWEPRLVLVHPAKLVRAERDMALRAGAEVYENSAVLEITSKPKFRLRTERGTVTAEKVVFATNAYSDAIPQLRRKQAIGFTYMIATEPLTRAQLEPIGWQGREGLEDARNLIHHYRITPDNRVTMGGGPVGVTFGNDLNADDSPAAWRHLEEHLRFMFPSLADARISHRWGGPFSVTLNLTPAIGYVGDRRAVYSLGCIGHGVSMSHLNAQVLRDLVLERESTLDCPFVTRRVIGWPAEPLRIVAATAVRGVLQAEDWVKERPLRRALARV